MRNLSWKVAASLGLAAIALGGCSGHIGDASGGGAPGVSGPGSSSTGIDTPGAVTAGKCKITPGLAPVRRLTRAEYNATVRDLLGETSRPADAFPAEVGSTEFGNDARALDFSRLLMEQYFGAAQTMATRVTADAKILASLLTCDPVAAGESSCAATFVDHFGARAYRRPLDAGEKQRLLAVYDAVRAVADFKTGIAAVLRTVLQAPQFLYRVELGVPVPANDGLVKIDHFEVATRLSYLLWGSMPDDALFEVARGQHLGTREEILAQAQRMIQDPKAREQVAYFHRLAFKTTGIDTLTRDRQTFPQWTPGLGRLLGEETARFLDYTVWDGAGDLPALLTAPYTFLNADLATFYGVSGPKTAAFERVALDPMHAAGFLTQAGPLALLSSGTQTNPVRRGLFVRDDLLCDAPPPPPPGLNVVPPKPEPGQTTRESFAQHSKDTTCAACHTLLDPLGFAFESFDAIGLSRTSESGKPIDTTGMLVGTDVDGPITGAVDLLGRVARSQMARTCYVKHWYEFAYGRGITDEDACAVATLDAEFEKAGLVPRDLLGVLTQIDPFLYKAVDR
jgi:Protein of unknown function (DUF1592)/Protein of unknown function (DUF1588)/Protein of unknown function (DUF1595)/Protein of unknown function (DUF1587)/Protein of unknown function (DUF1585)